MRESIRIVLVVFVFVFYLAAACTVELFNWIPFTLFGAGVICWLVAYYMPEKKEPKPKRERPLYTDWDECYIIATR